MARLSAKVLTVAALVCTPSFAATSTSNSCLVSLSATAADGASGTSGRMIIATADASGYCTFTVTACVNDASIQRCAPGHVDRLRIGAATDVKVSDLEQSLQVQLPTSEQVCAQTSVRVGQTRHRSIRAVARTSDNRGEAAKVILACRCPTSATSFRSTFEGIENVIFAQRGCTNQACHSSVAKQGGLDLSPGAAYQNLVGVPSSESSLNRVQPGDPTRSMLWLKLAASTNPSALPAGVQVPGAPMPNGLPPLSADELEAVRLWIFGGAPQGGTVGGTESLLNACLAPPEPITIKPLDPPAPGQGVQFVMPPWKLEAHSEHEICFATYYDITSQVPSAFQDPSGTMFRFSSQELRQDPQSHHLLLNRYVGSAADIHDPSFGAWTCNGGPHAGQQCEPTDLASCGSGTCTSEIQQSFACLGFGPPGLGGPTFYAIGGAQQAQLQTQFVDGVFGQVPLKGILFWNSHAFNLTDVDTVMHARINYNFAQQQTYPVQPIFDVNAIFAPNARPYKTQTVCNDFVLPQGARLFNLTSHTHKHGKHFTISGPDGTSLYESFVYNDPASVNFNPPLVFDSPKAAQRKLHYCSLYNNGVAADGTPDPATVTRYSHLPESARTSIGDCQPIACAAGRIGAPCSGVGDDRTCDSSPGANDGSCDACPITGGESTENEMFILIGDYYLDTSAAIQTSIGSPSIDLPAFDRSGRSTFTGLAVPAQMGCSSSHGGHAAHMAMSRRPSGDAP